MAEVTAGGTLNFDNHTDVVEAALDAEDYTPLVRVVFDAVASSLSTATTKQALLARAPQATPPLDATLEDKALTEIGEGRRASDRLKAMRKEAAAPVISALEKVVESRSAELSQICRDNAEEIVSSLQELDSMQQGTEELQERIQEGDAALRQAGSHFLNGLEQLQDLRGLQNCVTASCQVVRGTKQLLQLCAHAEKAVNADELYKAFKLLEPAHTEFLQPDTDQTGTLGGPQTARLSNRLLEGRVHSFLSARVEEMRAAIQQKALKDLNEWLVTAREQARPIGMLVLRKAAWDRQREESLAQQRRRLAQELPNISDVESAASAFAKPLPIHSAGTSKLHPAIHLTAIALLQGTPVDPFADVLAGIDMQRLHRCLQLHSCLGKTATLQEYYQMNRQIQLNNDLAAQGRFPTQYQSYLAQIVGFFVIEDRVSKAAEALSGAQVRFPLIEVYAGWESAVTYLKLAMETAFQTVDSATTMLAIKDFVLLVCSALGQRDYHVSPLLDVLMNARPRFNELLTVTVRPEVHKAVTEYKGVTFTVESVKVAADLSESLGLPLAVGSDSHGMGPTPPFRAPFSKLVPELLNIVRKYVEESAAFAWGLVSPAEVLSVVRIQRDTMLLEIPLPALETALRSIPSSDPSALTAGLQSMADLTAFADALKSLDDFTYFTVRRVHAKDRGGKNTGRLWSNTAGTASPAEVHTMPTMSTGSASNGIPAGLKQPATQVASYTAGLTRAFGELQSMAEQQLKDILSAQLKSVIQGTPPLEWTPQQPVQMASAHTPHVLHLEAFLRETLRTVAGRVPQGAYHRIGHILVDLVGRMLLGMLLSDDVPAFNLYGVFRLHGDALVLAEFAAKTDIPGLEAGLQEVIQFCDLLVTGRLEDILHDAKRAKSYPAVNLKTLLVLLRKYREIAPRNSHAHGIPLRRSRQPESFLKKKTAERVAKNLRAHLEAAGVPNLPK